MKKLVAKVLAARVKDGEVLGIGSGTTVELAVEEIGERIAKEGLKVFGVPTSHRIALRAQEAGIVVLSTTAHSNLVWSFDGADEVDDSFKMIKGRGGAMLAEKIMAREAKKRIIIVTQDKLVKALGKHFPIPVEVIPEASSFVKVELIKLGASAVEQREASNKYGPVVTEHNNLILDTRFTDITPELECRIKGITGVVESGLFIDCVDEVLVAKKTGVWSRSLKSGKLLEVEVS